MYQKISQLLLYGGAAKEEGVLARLGDAFRRWEGGGDADRDVRAQALRLLELAPHHDLGPDLWRGYLAWLILTDENPFSLACEAGREPGDVLKGLAAQDMETFQRLADFDFGPIERGLGMDCLSALRRYDGPGSRGTRFSGLLAGTAEEVLGRVSELYRHQGAGLLALDRAFHLGEGLRLIPIDGVEPVSLGDIVGCEAQKRELAANTEVFIAGRPANNVLLYGDGGTGKSTCVRALVNDYRDTRLRIIELYKHQFRDLPALIAKLKLRGHRFILFIDDLSFEEDEVEYKFLKAVVEGGLETRPDNVLIYATSNRRHIIRELWGDREDMEHRGDVHRSDTLEEKLSLASRFGLSINYSSPNRQQYHDIVRELARRASLSIDEQQLIAGADAWDIRHGGLSGRAAQQYVDYLAGRGV